MDGAKEVDAWVLQTVGLTFEAFCASVLLRQGRADDILDATPTKRLETLKKIIGVERYEALSREVNEASKGRKQESERLQQQRAGVADVTDDDLGVAAAAVENTTAGRERADAVRQQR